MNLRIVVAVKICIISKYPPIEGGVSSKVYWLAKALGERGHEVHIVTNALEVEDEYREVLDINDPRYSPKNVYVHSTDPSPTIEANPSHIPFSKMYCEKLASLAIKVIEDYNIDLIDSRYLIPYGVTGYLAKSLVNIPQIISHAGSDLQRLYPSPYLNRLLTKILKCVDGIITDQETASFFLDLGVPASRISVMPQTFVDTRAFSPEVQPFDLAQYITNQKYFPGIPIIAYIGKITHHFETKGLPELLKACSMINEEFILLFVANGKKMNDFQALVKKANLIENTLFLPFFPPWQIPSILKSCTCIVALENASSPTLSYHVPVVPAEAMATGRCVLISRDLHEKEPYNKLENGRSLLVANTSNINEIKESLERLIENPNMGDEIGTNAQKAISQNEQNEGYIDKIDQIYKRFMS
ncbi:glycosyltransferase [Candidatus Bathyarchaeota archaeon]|nr:glycosyltransferase [Candidatus Bathyarchaeota archaeon]